MANARKHDPNFEIITSTAGVATCNSRDKIKIFSLTENVTDLQAPIGAYPGDYFEFHITLNAFTLALNAAYTSALTTPPTLLANTILAVRVMDDGVINYWVLQTGA